MSTDTETDLKTQVEALTKRVTELETQLSDSKKVSVKAFSNFFTLSFPSSQGHPAVLLLDFLTL